MSTRNLNKLFHPKNVAVIGASEDRSKVGGIVLANLRTSTFHGQVYAVNNKSRSIDGIACYGTVHEIGSPVDLAIVCTPATTIPSIVRECGDAGVSVLMILSAGFGEIGLEGAKRESEVRQLASQYPAMRLVGPNCLGVLSPYHGMNASFAKKLPKAGRTAFLSQSGALCTAILDWSIGEGIGFSAVASLGNAIDIDLGDMIDYLASDPYTESIVLYVESIREARKFLSAAKAFTRTKPIIAYKAGRFPASAKAASSHTGAMVGEDSVYDAAFQRAGIVRVNDMTELFNVAEVLSRGKLPRGPNVAIVSNAGGPGIMAADALLSRKGTLATLAQATMEKLNRVLPDAWSHQNPIDILGDAIPSRYGNAVSIALEDEGVDGLIVMLTPQAMTDPTESARSTIGACAKSEKPVLAVWMGGESVQQALNLFHQAGISTFPTPEQAIGAFDYLVHYRRGREILTETPQATELPFRKARLDRQSEALDHSGLLNEIEAKALLNLYDIPTNETVLATSASEAVAIAKRLGCPVALKVVSPNISHKTNVGGVMLNLQGDASIAMAYEQIIENARKHQPDASLHGVSVQPMVLDPNAIELIVGTKRDPTFGPVLMIGSGGTMAELVHDRVVELPPLNSRLARRMLERMRMWPLLNGYRGRPHGAIDKLVETLIRLSFLVAERSEILELDINPLVVTPHDVIAVDARAVIEPFSLQAARAPIRISSFHLILPICRVW